VNLDTEAYARRSHFAAALGVEFLIIEQFLVGFLAILKIPPLNREMSSAISFSTIPFGILTIIYGVLYVALEKERLWAAIALLALVSLHTLSYVAAIIFALSRYPLDWPTLTLIGVTAPMPIGAILLARCLRHFNRLPRRNVAGFQVILPIDSSREK